jgi:hypothetical protein
MNKSLRPPKQKVDDHRRKRAEQIALRTINKAINGDTAAAKKIADITEGPCK